LALSGLSLSRSCVGADYTKIFIRDIDLLFIKKQRVTLGTRLEARDFASESRRVPNACVGS
jgi:hypothetical protein